MNTQELSVALRPIYLVSVTYETWDEEDVDIGETDKRGFEVEDEPATLGDILDYADKYNMTARSRGDSTGWWESTEDEDYRTGERTIRHLHVATADGKPLSSKQRELINKSIEDGLSYDSMYEDIWERYGDRIERWLVEVADAAEAKGMQSGGGGGDSDSLNMDITDPKTGQTSIVSVSLPNSEEFDVQGGGMNFMLSVVSEDGDILYSWAPRNMTPEVWVRIEDEAAVKRRWEEFKEGLDASYIIDVITDGRKREGNPGRAKKTKLKWESKDKQRTATTSHGQYVISPLPTSSGWKNYAKGEYMVEFLPNSRRGHPLGDASQAELVDADGNSNRDWVTSGADRHNKLNVVKTWAQKHHDRIEAGRSGNPLGMAPVDRLLDQDADWEGYARWLIQNAASAYPDLASDLDAALNLPSRQARLRSARSAIVAHLLPSRPNEVIEVAAHGRVISVKRTRNGWNMKIIGAHDHSRFADAKSQAVEDILYFMGTGALPRGAQVMRFNPSERDPKWDAEYGELRIYIDNDYALYQSMRKPIEANLRQKMSRGKYDSSLAPKAWMHLVDAGAKRYAREFDVNLRTTFPKSEVRAPLAEDYAREFEEEEKLQARSNPYVGDAVGLAKQRRYGYPTPPSKKRSQDDKESRRIKKRLLS